MSIQLLIAQVILLLLGIMGVATASPDRVIDHTIKSLIALLLTFGVAQIPLRFLLKYARVIWGVTLVLLMLVLVIGAGTGISQGTRRWISLAGFRFQPSELAKLGLVIQLASFFSRHGIYKKLISATGMIMATTLLIVLEPDMGTSILTFILGVVVMYAAGVHMGSIVLFIFSLVPIALVFGSRYIAKHPYILTRWNQHFGIMDPQKIVPEKENGLDQVGMAHRDLSLGGWWGHGPDGLRWGYFAAHTDLVIAAVGFSNGLLGVAMALFSYWLIVSTALRVSRLASQIRPMTSEIHGATILSTGCMFMIVGQAFLNLSVAAGLFPVTGVTLPLISYGFSSALTMSVALGIIHNCMRTVRQQLPKDSPDLMK